MSWQGGHKDLLADVSYVSCGTSGDSWILRPEELSAASGMRQDPRRACYVTSSGGCSLESFPFPFLMRV